MEHAMNLIRTLRVAGLVAIFLTGVLVGTAISDSDNTLQGDSTETHADTLTMLLAKDAITEQIYNYSRGLDRMDKELALSVWHAEATVDIGGNAKMTGPEWIESAWRTHEKITSHAHTMANIQIKVTGDTAVSESYFIASLHAEPTQESASTSLIRGRYADRWSHKNGRWAMDHRRIIVDFQTEHVAKGKNRPSAGKRDKTDPSYAIFH